MSAIPVYPFLYAGYLVIMLLAHNYGEVELAAGIRPIVVVSIVVAAIFLLFWGLFRDKHKAGLITFLTSFLVFSYGHIYEGLKSFGLPIASIVRHRFLLPALFILYLAALLIVWRKEIKPSLTKYLNLITLLILCIPIVRITGYSFEARRYGTNEAGDTKICDSIPQVQQDLPDIYLIVMDAYERGDILEEMHGFDNSEFYNWLAANGFYIAEGSLSNYNHTELSITSMLNMNYIQTYPEKYSENSNNRMGVVGMISDNLLRQELECFGYQTVAFETGLFWTEWEDADYYLSGSTGPFSDIHEFGSLSNFEALFFNTTLGRAISDGVLVLNNYQSSVSTDQHDELRNRILFTFDQLEQVPLLPSPKLVFVHVLSPHPPIVFGPNGESVNYGDFSTTFSQAEQEKILLDAYADQIVFLNSKLKQAVSAILEQSDDPPIIIIQGDHGWADRKKEDKLSIFNAYHFPNLDDQLLYPTITPVNSFRLILSHYFNTEYPLLPDESYFSDDVAVFQFEPITNNWQSEP